MSSQSFESIIAKYLEKFDDKFVSIHISFQNDNQPYWYLIDYLICDRYKITEEDVNGKPRHTMIVNRKSLMYFFKHHFNEEDEDNETVIFECGLFYKREDDRGRALEILEEILEFQQGCFF